MAKREITAKEAAKRLEAFGFKVGTDKDGKPIKPSWTAIDTFVKNNPKAKSVLKANKGAFVQRRSGFSNGGYNAQFNALKRSFDSGHITLQQFVERLKSISPVESTTYGTPEEDARIKAQAKAQGVTTLGQIDPAPDANLLSQLMTSNLGSLAGLAGAGASPTGIAMTANLGSVVAVPSQEVVPTGLSGLARVASVTPVIHVDVQVTGNALTMAQGSGNALIWNEVNTGTAPITPPGWQEVAA